jgi:hypothetical protein
MKTAKAKPTITRHARPDWCHLCGQERTDCVDIWGMRAAQLSRKSADYLRICGQCAGTILDTSKTKATP